MLKIYPKYQKIMTNIFIALLKFYLLYNINRGTRLNKTEKKIFFFV